MRALIVSVLALVLLSAGTARANTVFVPTSGWLVGPSTLVSDTEGGLPCVMMNQFSNGFVMRISGGGQEIMGFALDVRQNFFTAGQTYNLGIAVDSGFREVYKAQAYDAATLMAATKDTPEFYKALQNARELSIGIEGKTLKFVMLGARDGLERMETCFNPQGGNRRASAAAAPPAAGSTRDAPMMAGMKTAAAPPPKEDSVANAYRELLANKGGDDAADLTAPAPGAGEAKADIPLTAKSGQGQTMPPANTARPQSPQTPVAPTAAPSTAQALDKMEPSAGGGGSRLDALFARAEKSMKTQVPAAPAKPAPATVAAAPKLQPAPAMPARSFPVAGAAQGQALMPNGVVPITPRTPPAPRQMQVSAPAQPASHSQSWQAMQGQKLSEVLENWSNSAGARLVWKAQGDFTLPAGLAAQGTYESAVLSALKQFESGNGVQPIGQIYNDTASGQKVLVISE